MQGGRGLGGLGAVEGPDHAVSGGVQGLGQCDGGLGVVLDQKDGEWRDLGGGVGRFRRRLTHQDGAHSGPQLDRGPFGVQVEDLGQGLQLGLGLCGNRGVRLLQQAVVEGAKPRHIGVCASGRTRVSIEHACLLSVSAPVELGGLQVRRNRPDRLVTAVHNHSIWACSGLFIDSGQSGG
ncbi:hypothetical protein D3C86_1639320 [compost metagenome]